ncbi:Protein RADIALIS-like 6 [Glycine soja]|uniref:Protein RADIALIS-like 6 n=1 Tax=Glycine soja TaxID=3848 RepID=A0A445LFK6_GLYSO|nr:Protein RADIALIS-like 6 [Glycine soja]
MEDFAKSLSGWSWEENKLFELALAVVDEQHPERWEVVAAMVGGEKSAGDVQEHYVILLEDLLVIESGKLDHTLGEVVPFVLVECKDSICLSDNDTSILVIQLEQLGSWFRFVAVVLVLHYFYGATSTKVLLENHIHFKLQSHGHSVMIRNSNNKDKAIVRRSHQASFKLRQN